MFSRAVDPTADAGRTAAILTRTTLALSVVLAIPAAAFGPRLVRLVYGSQFADAGVALRLILPGVVAYSVVAVLSRYLSGRGRPGTGTLILLLGLAANVAANLDPRPPAGDPRRGTRLVALVRPDGARDARRCSSGSRAAAWRRRSIVRRSDVAAAWAAHPGACIRRLSGHRRPSAEDDVSVAPPAADIILGEHAPGEEP